MTAILRTPDTRVTTDNLTGLEVFKKHKGNTITICDDGINIETANSDGLSDGRWVHFDVIQKLIEG